VNTDLGTLLFADRAYAVLGSNSFKRTKNESFFRHTNNYFHYLQNHHNIKMDLREIGWNSIDWIDLAQDRDR
jgi:hypothetical protein